ncbi:MAG: CRISPR-associated endonuclease Cas2 [Eubacteriaceae bacterium]|nr:CRISPR-associated endonuclease Cas2 [Eubacteriaceae bacterium]
MRYIVSYDIADNRTRRRIMKACESFGQRVQLSVFECSLTKEQYKNLVDRLDKERRFKIGPEDSIRIYPLCADCSNDVKVLGYKAQLLTEQASIVI